MLATTPSLTQAAAVGSSSEQDSIANDRAPAAPVRRRTGSTTLRPPKTLNWRRVIAIAMTAAGHALLIGVLCLPETPALVEQTAQQSSAADTSERMTVFVALAEALPPALPARPARPLPVPPPPPPRPVADTPPPTDAVPSVPEQETVLPEALARVPSPASAAPAIAAADAGVAATQRVDAPVTAPAPAAVDPNSVRREREAYIRALMAALLQHRTYPAAARKEREQGVVHVRFSIDRDGQVLSSSVQRSAGAAVLDAAALDVLQRASPLPPIPASMGKDTLTITVPIEYALTTR